jgi:predicted aspartyl protease
MVLISPLHEFPLSGFAIVDQNEMDGNYLIVTYTFHDQENVIQFYALIDCGATGYTFIDEDFACCHHLPLHLLKSPRNLIVIDGRPITSGAITDITRTCLAIHNHQEDIPLFVTKLAYYPIDLGIPWL